MSNTLRLRTVWFWIYVPYGVVLPFLPVIFHELGFNDSQISFILVAQYAAALLPPALIGHLADRHLQARNLISGLMLLSAICALLWLQNFAVAGMLAVTFAFFSGLIPAATLIEALTFKCIGSDPKLPAFSTFRLWGTLGFIFPALLLALLSTLQILSPSYLIIFTSGLCLVAALSARLLPGIEIASRAQGLPTLQALKVALRPPLIHILIGSGIAGAGLAMFYMLFPRYLQELGYSTAVIGLVSNLGVVAEAVMMFAARHVLSRATLAQLVTLSALCIGVRMTALGLYPNQAVILFSQLLHAPIIFGLFIAGPMLLAKHSDESYRFSLQALYTVIIVGLARIGGNLLLVPLLRDQTYSALDNLRHALVVAGMLALVGGLWIILFTRHLFFSNQPGSGSIAQLDKLS